MFWYNKKERAIEITCLKGVIYPRDFWKREEINRIGNCM
jgi:hypothetical protein